MSNILTSTVCSRLAKEMEASLWKHILHPWYPRAVDTNVGGFYQNFDEQWRNFIPDPRTIVYQSRLTWVAAEVAKRYPDKRDNFVDYIRHGVAFLQDNLWDKQGGGFFWSIDDKGQPTTTEKHAYGIAFGIYALSTAYAATKDAKALDLAKKAFAWLEAHAHDKKNGGYYEPLARDGKPVLTGAQKDAIGTRYGLKSMNTHIHLLEAFASLYSVWPDPLLKERLSEVFLIVRDKVASPAGYLYLYLTPAWEPVPDHDSFGHDIETTYLLHEAAEILNHPHDTTTEKVARHLTDHALDHGWDKTHGGFYDAGVPDGKLTVTDKIWWTQAEGLNALLLLHELHGKETNRFAKAFLKQWEFITKYQLDERERGWRTHVKADGTVVPNQPKSDMWKDPYHQGRALLNVIARLNHLAGGKSASHHE